MSGEYRKELSSLNQKYYEDIIALMPGHVYWKDKSGVFLGCNMQQVKDAGFKSPDEIIGKTDEDMPWSIQATYLREIDLKVMQSERPLTLEELFELPDGTKKIYLSKKIPLYDEQNRVSGILGISFDITERKKLEEDLVKAKKLAEEANRVKTEFLENMRHDLRTPLTGIVGFAEIIRTEVRDVKIKEYTDNLIAASHTLLEFLNEILEAIRVLTGDIPIAKKKFSLSEATGKIIQLIKPKALEKHLAFSLSYDTKIPKYVIGDPTRIQRILLELISNALNFTHKGSVTVIIKLAKKQKRELVIKCTIQDTGIGILPEKQEEVFLRFKRLSSSYDGIYKGAGLGLTIVKQFIDDIHGEVYCQSKVKKGSTFTCLIPLQESLLDDATDVTEINAIKYDEKIALSSKKSKTRNKEKQLSKTQVLLVEDQPVAAEVAKTMIEKLDCEADVAENAEQALKFFQKNKYDLIFMDVGLPDINGNELTKRIRAKEWKLDQHVPIVALTAHIDSENRQECIESGMDAVLSKPLTYNTAKDIINAFVPAHRLIENPTKKETPGNAPLKIEGSPIDLALGMTNLNTDDVNQVKEMIGMLIRNFKKDLPKFTVAKDQGDWDSIQAMAHKYHGSSLYCGIPRFQQACANLEKYLHNKKTDLRDRLYQQLLDEMNKLCKEQDNL